MQWPELFQDHQPHGLVAFMAWELGHLKRAARVYKMAKDQKNEGHETQIWIALKLSETLLVKLRLYSRLCFATPVVLHNVQHCAAK